MLSVHTCIALHRCWLLWGEKLASVPLAKTACIEVTCRVTIAKGMKACFIKLTQMLVAMGQCETQVTLKCTNAVCRAA